LTALKDHFKDIEDVSVRNRKIYETVVNERGKLQMDRITEILRKKSGLAKPLEVKKIL
jgi:hypothetical protein